MLLDFWASWCAPCREESPQVDSLYKKYKSKGLSLIGISLDVDQKAWKDAIAKDHISAWNHVNMDRLSGAIRDQYYVGAIPLLILIDPKGIIVGKYLGDEPGGTISDLARDLENRMQ